AFKYCQELKKADTATSANFEHVLPKLDERVLFTENGFLSLVVQEVKNSNKSYYEFYADVYNVFSSTCYAYQVLQVLDTSIQLHDPEYFTTNFCNCFNEETGGEIINGDLTVVLETCNEKLGHSR